MSNQLRRRLMRLEKEFENSPFQLNDPELEAQILDMFGYMPPPDKLKGLMEFLDALTDD